MTPLKPGSVPPTDLEMLYLAYGALKVGFSNTKDVVEIIEAYLFRPNVTGPIITKVFTPPETK